MTQFLHPNSKRHKQNDRKAVRCLIGLSLKIALLLVIAVFYGPVCDADAYSLKKQPPQNNHPMTPQYVESLKTLAPDRGVWEGPVLYFKPGGVPLYLILIEKASQELSLYHYDGAYKLIKRYRCVTGQRHGKKQREKDKKTPEGIFFNTKTFRDKKITIFGDRAFGLNYPDIFDEFDGNGGSGIFIHGTNRALDSYSSNGCLVMRNSELKTLDNRIDFKLTPVIIGERLPYTFAASERDFAELIPFLKNAMLPPKYAGLDSEISSLVILGMQERVVALGEVIIKKTAGSENIRGYSKLYLAGPGANFLVLIKREWHEETIPITIAKVKTRSSKDKARISPIQPLQIVTPAPSLSERPTPSPAIRQIVEKPEVTHPEKERRTFDSPKSVQPEPKPSERSELLPENRTTVEKPAVTASEKEPLTTEPQKITPLPTKQPVVEQPNITPSQKEQLGILPNEIVFPAPSQSTPSEQFSAKKPAVETSEMVLTDKEQTAEGRIEVLVESWRKAWEEKRLDDYITFYHPDFKSKNKNLAAWKKYKKILNQRNKKISIKISDIKVFLAESSVYVSFRQHYRSDTFKASGFKILELKKDKNLLKIYREKMVKSDQDSAILHRLKNKSNYIRPFF